MFILIGTLNFLYSSFEISSLNIYSLILLLLKNDEIRKMLNKQVVKTIHDEVIHYLTAT